MAGEPTPLTPAPEAKSSTREATAADVENIDSIKLEDFAADFSKVKIPENKEGERLSAEELDAAVESFLDSLRTP